MSHHHEYEAHGVQLKRMGNMEQVMISCFMGSFLLCAILVLDVVHKVSGNAEGDALNALKNSLSDPNGVLQSWDSNLVNPCTWFRVTCSSDNSVTRVDLGNANLSGTLVPQLGQLPNLQYLELYSNNITGKIPNELGNLTNLVSLDLFLNNLTGPIPDTLGKLGKLRFLRLNNNTLSGDIPMVLTAVGSLQVLDLSNNQLTGNVPTNGSFSLFTPNCFKNNPGLHHTSTPAPPPETASGKSSTGAIAGGVAAGAALLFAAPAIALVYWRRKKSQDCFFDVQAEEDPEVHIRHPKRFSLLELQVATDNFSSENIVGIGGFSEVYKGHLANGSLVAVKRFKEAHTWELETEVFTMTMAVHRNLIRLQGFCLTPTEQMLVYPFMHNGSVASWLHDRLESQPPLDWPKRKGIALGSARGLAYLHDHCDPKIIHRDVKPHNVLLDEDFEAVVVDFGLAKLVDYKDDITDIMEYISTTRVCGTMGYMPPEIFSTGMASEKIDVYGYGMMIHELITGRKVVGAVRLADDYVYLLDWVKRLMKDKRLETLVDADLGGNYDEEEVERLIQVALLCTHDSPAKRPKMSEVVGMLKGDGLAEKWDEWQKDEKNWHVDRIFYSSSLNEDDSISTTPPNELSGDWILDSSSEMYENVGD